MRLLTFRASDGQPHLGVLHEGRVVDISAWLMRETVLSDIGMTELIAMGNAGFEHIQAAIYEAAEADSTLALEEIRLLAPIPRPRKNVICLGRNYAEHAAESAGAFGQALPAETPAYPAVFTKAVTSVIGPYDDIPYDADVSVEIDWESELAIVVGRTGKQIKREHAFDYIFGYMVLNDISARDIQRRHGNQFFMGKSLDGSCPTGPWIVTADEIEDPNNLELYTLVNGVEKQRDNTRAMIWDVPAIIEVVSLGMTLEPGDIIATGTPAGVGFARKPPEFLKPGDIVECGIEKIGAIRNRVSAV
jgi:2-keto-4-pentenoate hydratase/2-oxohepta-3-ene-1,7-dioic acid hydratase in catechol pathway